MPKIKDFLRLLHQLERKSEINQHLQDVIVLKQYLNSRDCVLLGRYRRHSYFWGGIAWVDLTPEFIVLNRVLDEHIARLTHKSKAVSRLENALSLLFSIYNTRVNPIKLLTITCFLANLSAAGAKPLPRSVDGAVDAFHRDYSFRPGHTALTSIDLPTLIHNSGSYHVDIQPFPRETGLGIYPISIADVVFNKAPEHINSFVHKSTTGVDERSTAIVDYGNGQFASLASALQQNGPTEACINGELGYIRIPQFVGAKTLELHINDQDPQYFEYDFSDDENFKFEIAHVTQCILQKQTQSSVLPLGTSLRVMNIMDTLRAQWQLQYSNAVESAELLVNATQKSIQGGIRINLDLLDAQQQLFSTQGELAQARYNYLLAYLRLKMAAGTLALEDLQNIASYFILENREIAN